MPLDLGARSVTCDLIPLAVLKQAINVDLDIKKLEVTCDLIPLAVLKQDHNYPS